MCLPIRTCQLSFIYKTSVMPTLAQKFLSMSSLSVLGKNEVICISKMKRILGAFCLLKVDVWQPEPSA